MYFLPIWAVFPTVLLQVVPAVTSPEMALLTRILEQGILVVALVYLLYRQDKDWKKRTLEKLTEYSEEKKERNKLHEDEMKALLANFELRYQLQEDQKEEVIAIYNARLIEKESVILGLQGKVAQYEELQTKELKAALGLMAGTAVSVKNVNNAMDSGVLTKSVRVDELKAFMTEFLNRMSNGGEH